MVSLAGFLLLFVAALQPVNGAVFVLDGLLIGAGDMAFLAKAMIGAAALTAPVAGAVLVLDLGIGWVWGAVTVLMAARLGGAGAAVALGGLGRGRRRGVTEDGCAPGRSASQPFWHHVSRSRNDDRGTRTGAWGALQNVLAPRFSVRERRSWYQNGCVGGAHRSGRGRAGRRTNRLAITTAATAQTQAHRIRSDTV